MIYLMIIAGTISNVTEMELIAFQTKEKCERNIPYVKDQLKEKYSKMVVQCIERKIIKGK